MSGFEMTPESREEIIHSAAVRALGPTWAENESFVVAFKEGLAAAPEITLKLSEERRRQWRAIMHGMPITEEVAALGNATGFRGDHQSRGEGRNDETVDDCE